MSVFFQPDDSRTLPILLSLCLLCILAGCGGPNPGPSPDPEPPAKTAAEPKPNPPPKKPAKKTEQKTPAAKEEKPAPDKRPVSNDPKKQLEADLDDAIALLEKGDLATFMERYMPLKELQNIRQFSTVEKMAKNIKVGGVFEKEWLDKLRAMKKAEIEFQDAEKSKATIVAETSSSEEASHDFHLTDPAEEKIPHFEGFPGDVQAAIEKAIAALEAGEHRKFVENMFPESELRITKSDEEMQALEARLKEHPQMVKGMIADLKALQKLKPKLDAGQTMASFELNPGTRQARTIRFEKAGTWRMANTAEKMRQLAYKQSRQVPIGIKKTSTTRWERIRDHWRLASTH